MTELQVMAFEQMSTALAAFDRDHRLIDAGDLDTKDDPTYDTDKTSVVIAEITERLQLLCAVAGRSDL